MPAPNKFSNGWKMWFVAGVLLSVSSASAETLTVLAASSTTDAMKEAGDVFEEQTGHGIRFSFASSGALARQVQSGAPADLFLSANEKWMDAVGMFMDESTRVDLLRNRLVVVVPTGGLPPECRMLNKEPQSEEGRALQSSEFLVRYSAVPGFRLATGDVRSVPAGIYAKEALEYTGQFEALRPKMVMASSVRGALIFVERGEVDAGIVYATDAKISERVEVVSTFSLESHSAINYPAAVCRASKHPRSAGEFLTFLQSEEAEKIFEKHGFVVGQGGRSLQSLPRNNEASLSSFESLYSESLCLLRNQENTRSRIREARPTITREEK